MRRKDRGIDFEEVVSDVEREPNPVELPLKPGLFKAIFTVTVIICLLFLANALFLAVAKGNFYKTRAERNMHKEIPILAQRGLIVDRFGKPILENKFVLSAFLNPSVMLQMGEKDEALKALSETLNIPEMEIKDKLSSANLEENINLKIAEDISTSDAIKLKDLSLNSISVEGDYKRHYVSPAFSHVLGYVGLPTKEDLESNEKINLLDSIGKAGLEKYYNDILLGRHGEKIILRDARLNEQEEKLIKEPETGETLQTTLDGELQEYFYERLLAYMKTKGQTAGAGIAINPKNGEVLSLISLPSFEPDNISKYLNAKNQPLFNRVVSGLYSPGSTIKPLHATAALEEGVISTTASINSRGQIEIPNPYFPDNPSYFVDWKAHGWVNLYSAIARSSNIFFYTVGGGLPKNEAGIVQGTSYPINSLGITRLNKYWLLFGLGRETGIDLGVEPTSFLPTAEEKEKRTGIPWRVGDTYNISIGQGDLNITPLQILDTIIAVANEGLVYRPKINMNRPEELLFDVSDMAKSLKEVKIGMQDAVSRTYGTAYMLSGLPIKVAAKTGSAQTALNTKTNAMFVGYAPADNPTIAILILIEDAVEGSSNTLPIARDVFEWYYQNRLSPASSKI
ncbi:MAG: hypothetical protein HYS87_02960 [Candidatus Colwellbacteria bacterium]|nr:hypothetical protein [Candidatus Colwellbacteria bacterium]